MNGQHTPGDLKKAKQEAVKLLLRPNGNVVGVGIGEKETDGTPTTRECVRIYVVSKLYAEALSLAARVPSSVLGVPTDVIEVERFGRKGRQPKPSRGRTPKSEEDTRPRPGASIRVKTSAPNVNSGFLGTLGAVVTDGKHKYILSCNHNMASNGRVPLDATIVSAEFVGIEEDLATAPRPVPLAEDSSNFVDCALAELNLDKVQPTILGNLALDSDDPIAPTRGMKIVKFAGNGDVQGTIVDVDADLYVDYSFGTFRLDDQVIIKGDQIKGDRNDFAVAGDSGTMVIAREKNQATAMIFAASGQFAVACPLSTAFEELNRLLNVKEKLKLCLPPKAAAQTT